MPTKTGEMKKRAGALTLLALAFGMLAGCEFNPPQDRVTPGERDELAFYYRCLGLKCALDNGRAILDDPEDELRAFHVVNVERLSDPSAAMPAYTFVSEDDDVFEIDEVGCDGYCDLDRCEYETSCDAPRVYHVFLRPVAPGEAKLLVLADEDGEAVDAATVTIAAPAEASAE